MLTAEPAHAGRVYYIFLLLYFAFVVYGSLVPLEYRPLPLEKAIELFRRLPYRHVGIRSRSDVVANLLLFIPLTFAAMGALTRENRRRGRLLIALAVVAAASLLSVAIEFAQVYFPRRTVSLNDILAETAGGFIGVTVWFLFGRRITRWTREVWRQRAGGLLAAKLLSGYAVFLVIYQLFPFDLTISPVEVYHKLKGGRVTIVPLADLPGMDAYTILSKAGLMVPMGLLFAMVQRSGRRHPIVWSTVLATVFAGLVEGAQLFVYSRYSTPTDVLIGALGGFVGAVLAFSVGPPARRSVLRGPFWARWGTAIKLLLVAAGLAGLAWQKWQPFDFTWPPGGLAEMSAEAFAVPLTRQYYLSEATAASQVLRELTTVFILGMLLRSIRPGGGRGGKLACALLAGLFAIVLESGQLLLPGRYADATAMAIGCAGGVLGVWLYDGFVRTFLTPSPKP